MLEAILLDNDVVLKMCGFAAGTRLVEIATHDGHRPAVLQVASYSLRTQARRSRSLPDREGAAAQLAILLEQVDVIEPTGDEVYFAADLEERAIMSGLHLDAGESQLVAVLLHRRGPLIISGDKRAIVALNAIAPQIINGRIACFEQAVAATIAGCGCLEPFRALVCRFRMVDKAIANCFSCSSPAVTLEEVMTGLRSYTAALRSDTGRLLINSDDLVAIASQENRIGLV